MRPDDEAPDGGYVETTALRPVRGIPFAKGADPRRAPGGVPRAILEAREALTTNLPAAVEKLRELLTCGDRRFELAAAIEVCDRTIGRPKTVDADTEGAVRQELAVVFQRLREKLEPEAYKILLAEIAENEK